MLSNFLEDILIFHVKKSQNLTRRKSAAVNRNLPFEIAGLDFTVDYPFHYVFELFVNTDYSGHFACFV